MTPHVESDAYPRRLLLLGALAYTCFVIYGSLVPLQFQALPWATAVARFAAIPFLELGIDSRADWVANLLLFMPLTFTWMGALSPRTGRIAKLFTALTLVGWAIGLSFAIEFTQLFFPPRTVSQNDIMAESLGGACGMLLWWVWGAPCVRLLRDWQGSLSRTQMAERLAWVYLAGLVIYNVLPLDLTINPVDIFHKWREGRLNLLPFAGLPRGVLPALYEIGADILTWVPLALLWRLGGGHGPRRVWAMTMATALGLEAMQLFVYSRFSDVTDLFTAAGGALAGVWLGGRYATGVAPIERPGAWRRALPLVLALLWGGVVLAVFWYPFDFNFDGAYIRARLDFIYHVPFETYYIGSEFRAITEVLHKLMFFAPFGALLAWGVASQPPARRGILLVLSMLLMVSLPALVEFGQALLPLKVPDTVDWSLEWLGALLGYGLARRLARAQGTASADADNPGIDVVPRATSASPGYRPLWAMAAATLLFWAAAHVPFLPYNVRELLQPDAAWKSALLLATASYWLAVWPVWLARRRISALARLVQLPLGLCVYGAFSFLLLYMAVPEESLQDVVGAPLLRWPGQWELGLRWLALSAGPGVMMYLAALSVRRWRGFRLAPLHFAAALPVLVVVYQVVVVGASTDNLTELMASPSLLAFAALCSWLYVLFVAAALLASPAKSGQNWVPWLGLLLSLPLAVGLLQVGLAGQIDKYGQQFAAIQFLLSTDRQHYAPLAQCWLRYAVLHLLVIGALVLVQQPHFRSSAHRFAHRDDHSRV